MTTPLPMPPDFNPQTNLPARPTDNGLMHETRRAAAFAAQLVANGTPQDLALAEKALEAVLACQERNPNDAHYGGFFWMVEDKVVEDLNAVEFNLEQLIPMMLQHGDRLSPALRQRVLDAIRLGLDEIRRLDVLVAYSNITLLDILNSCLGGELLGDAEITQRGYRKLVAWMAFTDMNGAPFEYNSPTYTSVDIRALHRLASLVKDNDTQVRARLMSARLGLSAALHIHARTGRWAGPHSRAYHPSVVGETPPEINLLRQWIAEGALPSWLGDALDARPDTFEVSETASVQRLDGLTTYHSPSFALGVASKEYTGQSDVVMLHYQRPGAERPGVMYTRYLTNDKWLGDFYHATDRTRSRNLIEEGSFWGAQNGARAIALYTIGTLSGPITSAKACLIFTQRELVDEMWVGEQRVQSLPREVAPGEVIVIGSGGALVAIRPLARDDLGRDAPIRLAERQGDLVLELYNYLGPQKGFWDMRWPGFFFKGKPRCGFYLEAAERSSYPDGQSFARAVAAGALIDAVAPAFTYAGAGERLWTVEYSRDGQTVGIQIDLMAWALKERWTQDGSLDWPLLESPMARQTRTGHVVVGDAALTCGRDAAWLFASPKTGRYVAAYHGQTPAPLTLLVPGGSVQVEEMGAGTVVWDNGEVTVEAIGLQGTPKIEQSV